MNNPSCTLLTQDKRQMLPLRMDPASVNTFAINNSMPTSEGKPEVILIRPKWLDRAGPVTKKSLGTSHFKRSNSKA